MDGMGTIELLLSCYWVVCLLWLQSTDVSVAVGALRSSDGAILDPDDRLMDVVDDREQLVACLSDTECHPANGLRIGIGLRGDGTSASSNSGSPSPDFLHRTSRKDIEVTGEFADTGDLLQVRRGSEPALNHLNPAPSFAAHPNENIPRDYKVNILIHVPGDAARLTCQSIANVFCCVFFFGNAEMVGSPHSGGPIGLWFRKPESGAEASVGSAIRALRSPRVHADLRRRWQCRLSLGGSSRQRASLSCRLDAIVTDSDDPSGLWRDDPADAQHAPRAGRSHQRLFQ